MRISHTDFPSPLILGHISPLRASNALGSILQSLSSKNTTQSGTSHILNGGLFVGA